MSTLKEDFAKIVHLAHRGVMSQDEIALVVRVEEEINANGTAGADDIEYVCSLAWNGSMDRMDADDIAAVRAHVRKENETL